VVSIPFTERHPDFQQDLSIPQGVRAIQSQCASSYRSWQFFRELPTQNKSSSRVRQFKTEKFSRPLTPIKTAKQIQAACSNGAEHPPRCCQLLSMTNLFLKLHSALRSYSLKFSLRCCLLLYEVKKLRLWSFVLSWQFSS